MAATRPAPTGTVASSPGPVAAPSRPTPPAAAAALEVANSPSSCSAAVPLHCACLTTTSCTPSPAPPRTTISSAGWPRFCCSRPGLGYVYTHTAPQPTVPDGGVAYESVTPLTDDGLQLTASYVLPRNRAAILLFPGASRGDEARMLLARGFGLPLLDPRGQGGSDGDTVRWAGDEDLRAGATYLQHRPQVDADRIGAVGFSFGGEMLLRAAAESGGIHAVDSEGAGESVGETDVSGIARLLVDPSQVMMKAATTIFSDHMLLPPIVDRIGAISPRPVLHRCVDPGIGGESTRQPEYFAAAGDPKDIWEVPEARHTGGIDAEPVEYERRLTAFFEASLLGTNHQLERSSP
jgi:uncharacterized protein